MPYSHLAEELTSLATGLSKMNYHSRVLPILVAFALGVSACSSEAPPAAEQPAAAGSTAAVASPPPSVATQAPTKGGDGSPISLTGLTEADFSANPLEGELTCSFAADANAAPLLVARGFADDEAGRAQALARIGSEPQRLMALAPGGFDAMIVGGRFGGPGMTYTITLDRSEVTPGGESPANPARMLLQRADGAERTFAGTWTCGP
jgi:hypothetical protein